MSQLLDPANPQDEKGASTQGPSSATLDVEKTRSETQRDGETDDNGPETPVAQLEKWNVSQRNVLRFGVALYGFIIMGMNDAVLGVSDGPTKHRVLQADTLTKGSRHLFPM